MISREAIHNFDFEDFLQQHGVEVELKGNELAGTCPFCNWKRTSFYVSALNGKFMCHQCGEKGGPAWLISKMLNISYKDAEKRIEENFTLFVKDYDYDDDEELVEAKVANVIKLPEGFRPLYGATSQTSKPYMAYAYSRGITDDMLAEYNIGYTVKVARWADRLIVPVYHFGKLVSFVARDVTDRAKLKVDTPWGNEQGSYCFNLDNIWGEEEVVITEGVFDALTLPEMAVATFGKKISSDQINLLRKSGAKTLIFCYDEDALDEGEKFSEMWSGFFHTKIIELPKGKDPSELGRDKMLLLLRTAEEVESWLA